MKVQTPKKRRILNHLESEFKYRSLRRRGRRERKLKGLQIYPKNHGFIYLYIHFLAADHFLGNSFSFLRHSLIFCRKTSWFFWEIRVIFSCNSVVFQTQNIYSREFISVPAFHQFSDACHEQKEWGGEGTPNRNFARP